MKDNKKQMSSASSQTEDIFFEALKFDTADKQKAFVQTACMGDQELQREVDLLFESRDAAQVLFADESPLLITAEDLVNTISNLPEFLEYEKSDPSNDGAEK